MIVEFQTLSSLYYFLEENIKDLSRIHFIQLSSNSLLTKRNIYTTTITKWVEGTYTNECCLKHSITNM